ncbi:MAG: sulfotransferase [Anaerolineaceae bacterium]|nr:sulfotransferase [Anaerolineaceae bacterium]
MSHRIITEKQPFTLMSLLDHLVDAVGKNNRRAKRRSERWWANLWIDIRLYFRLLYLSLFRSKNSMAPITRRRVFFLALFIPVWTFAQSMHWFFLLMDDLFHPEYRQETVEKPVFIIGNFRSGSTFLQRLMAKDRQNFASFRMWEIFLAPSIIERQFARLLMMIDKAFGSPIWSFAQKFDQSTMGQVDIHKVSFFAPEEDENLFFPAWASAYINYLFPFKEEIPDYLYFDEKIPESRKTQLFSYYKRMVKRHMHAHPESRYYLSKSPSFSAKVESLAKNFPDARFVYLTRTPLEVVPSTNSWLGYAYHYFSDCPVKYPYQERIIPLCKHYYFDTLKQLEAIDPERVLIVEFEDLVADPAGTVRLLYERMGYPMNPAFEKVLEQEAERSRGYVSDHEYDLEEMGFSKAQIVEEFAEIFERFGYSTD